MYGTADPSLLNAAIFLIAAAIVMIIFLATGKMRRKKDRGDDG